MDYKLSAISLFNSVIDVGNDITEQLQNPQAERFTQIVFSKIQISDEVEDLVFTVFVVTFSSR